LRLRLGATTIVGELGLGREYNHFCCRVELHILWKVLCMDDDQDEEPSAEYPPHRKTFWLS
jgi:hypothetical protein